VDDERADIEMLAELLRAPARDSRLDELLDRVGLPRDLRWIGGFVRHPEWERRKSPDTGRVHPSFETLIVLLRSPAGPKVESLSLTFPPARGSEGVAAAIAECAVALRLLKVIGAWQGPAIARALAGGALPALRCLDLNHTPIGADGMAALARAPWLGQLEWLSLELCNLGPAGVRALIGASMPRLASLDLTAAGVDADGAQALAAWPSLDGVATLTLRRSSLGDAGLAALLGSPHLEKLVRLDLAQCGIDAIAAERLAAWSHLPQLEKLNLSGNDLRLHDEKVWGETELLYIEPAHPVAQRISRILGERVGF
jgi:hypothetical protein